MRYVVTAVEMQELDAATINEVGLPGAVLMENAGRAVARDILEQLDVVGETSVSEDSPDVAVVCGGGNNGGDGYVVARWLREEGVHATVYLAAPAESVRGDAKLHLGVYQQLGGLVLSIADADGLADYREAIESADVVVDCVFGTGLTREVQGHYRAVIEAINRARGARLAVDIPSGLSADTGQRLGVAVNADRTVTMAFLKVGLAVAPGFARCGLVRVAEIGIPRELAQAHGVRLGLIDDADVAGLLSPLSPLDHKNRRGHVVVVAGSPGKRGAARLTARSALRSGAGLVTLAAGGSGIASADPVMTASLDIDGDGALDRLVELAEAASAIAIGPGMPTTAGGRELVLGALERLETPLVVDADALNHIGCELHCVAESRPPVVLTPHPGEAARLLGCSPADIEADRVAAVRELADKSRAAVVLKGARTLVCDGIADDGFVTVNPTGNPGLATAGTGDVLTGLIAALIAQQIPAAEAARLGVFVHGRAADLLEDSLGQRGMIASDIVEAIPGALQSLD